MSDSLGKHLSEETKAKISAALTGRKRTEEFKKKLSISKMGHIGYWRGKKRDPFPMERNIRTSNTLREFYSSEKGLEVLYNRSLKMKGKKVAWNKGKKLTEEEKRKLIEVGFTRKGKEVLEETRRKISISCKGKTLGRKRSAATKYKISLASKGRFLGKKQSPEQILKRIESRRGYTPSAETRRKISEGNKGKIITEEAKQKKRLTLLHQIETGEIKNKYSSKSEILWGKRVEDIFGVHLKHSKWVAGRCFDYQYKNYLFEIDCWKWHETPQQKVNDKLKDELAIKYGYILIRFEVNDIRHVEEAIRRDYSTLQRILEHDG